MDTLLAMFRAQVARGGDRAALRTRAGGLWVATSWREWEETSLALAAALADLGVGPGDRVAILAHPRREWAEIDLGILLAGAITVPVYPQAIPEGVAHILADAAAAVVIAEDPLQVEKLFDLRGGSARALQGVRRVVYLDAHRRLDRPDARGRLEVRLDDVVPPGEASRLMAFSDLLAAGRRILARDGDAVVRARGDAVTAETPATIMYTSGTEGPPRGVVLTHGNFAFEVGRVVDALGLTPADEQLLFLPLAHIVGRVLLIGAIRAGCVTAFAESSTRVLDNLAEVHPTFFGAAPGFFESLRAGMESHLRTESALRQRTAAWALGVGRTVAALRRAGKVPGPVLAAQHRVASATTLVRVRRAVGRRLRFALVGGASLPRELAEWFHGCDVLLLEGYGLTETTAATHLNTPEGFRFGSVGRAIAGVETRIAEDGEVRVRGGNVMDGYHGRPDETAAAVSAEGWLRTGDTGSLGADGYLTITGRTKDLLVTSGGRKVAPQNLEAALRRSPWIAQAVAVGEGRPWVGALVVLAEDAARAWAREAHPDLAWPDICRHPEVRRRLDEAVEAVNRETEAYARIQRYAVLERPLTVEAGELTPTLKIRRREVTLRYAAEIEGLYDGPRPG